MRQQKHTHTLCGIFFSILKHFSIFGQILRSSQAVDSFSLDFHLYLLPAGAKRNLFYDFFSLCLVKIFSQCRGGGIGFFKGIRKCPHNHIHIFPFGQWNHLFHLQFPCCNGAGFIQAQNIHSGQGFDGFHFLHKGIFLCQTPHTQYKRNAGEQHQTLRYHTDNPGNGIHNGVRKTVAGTLPLNKKQQYSHWNQHITHIFDDATDGILHLRCGTAFGLCFFHKLSSIIILPDMYNLCHGTACHHIAAGINKIPFFLLNCQRLPCKKGFIDFHPVGGEYFTIHRNLVPQHK